MALALLLVVAMISSTFGAFVFAAGTAQFTVTSPSGNPGAEVTVQINLTNNFSPTLGALTYQLVYDPAVLSVVSRVKGDAYSPFVSPSLNSAYATGLGALRAVRASSASVDGVTVTPTTNAQLLTIVFKIADAAPVGSTALTLQVSAIRDVNSSTSKVLNTDYTVSSGSITVNDATPVEPALTLTKANESQFLVSVAGCVPTNSYQIWAYEAITSDIFGGERNNNWVLKEAYTLGSSLTLVSGQTRSKLITAFNSVDSNYTIAVRVKNNSGAFVQQLKDTFNDTTIGNLKISKVLVDGKISFDTTEVKEIKTTGSSVVFTIVANLPTTYTASTSPSTPISGTGNVFTWDTSALEPGRYDVKLGAGSDTRIIPIQLFKASSAATFGSISGVAISAPTTVDNKLKYTISPAFGVTTGKDFQYNIGEQWRAPFFRSVKADATTMSSVDNTTLATNDYGVFSVTSLVKKANGDTDDGITKTIINKRPGADTNFTLNVSGTGAELTPITFSATNPINMPGVQYSFWRRDAKGWILVKDYSIDTAWTWTPSRIGAYTVQIRAKGENAKSYEVLKATDVEVTKSLESLANVTDVTTNSLIGALARTPIMITASATSSDPDLMYKYMIYNSFIYSVETTYSIDPSYLWVPGKAGNYKVIVLVKNSKSFGKYDFSKSFDVTVG